MEYQLYGPFQDTNNSLSDVTHVEQDNFIL